MCVRSTSVVGCSNRMITFEQLRSVCRNYELDVCHCGEDDSIECAPDRCPIWGNLRTQKVMFRNERSE